MFFRMPHFDMCSDVLIALKNIAAIRLRHHLQQAYSCLLELSRIFKIIGTISL